MALAQRSQGQEDRGGDIGDIIQSRGDITDWCLTSLIGSGFGRALVGLINCSSPETCQSEEHPPKTQPPPSEDHMSASSIPGHIQSPLHGRLQIKRQTFMADFMWKAAGFASVDGGPLPQVWSLRSGG
ncbi:unnamed protein product [Gadus morhua 'NCC']